MATCVTDHPEVRCGACSLHYSSCRNSRAREEVSSSPFQEEAFCLFIGCGSMGPVAGAALSNRSAVTGGFQPRAI